MRVMSIKVAGLMIACLVAAAIGLGLSYHSPIQPGRDHGEFAGVHPDGWVEDGAELRLSTLASRGNRLSITFNSWRPGGQAPAQVKISVCGQEAVALNVTSDTPVLVPLRGACEPRAVRFDIANAFRPTANDSRKLGVKLKAVEVYSRFGIPLVRFGLILEVAACVFLIALLWLLTFQASVLQYLAYLLPAGAAAMLSTANDVAPKLLAPFWVFALAVALGAWAGAAFFSGDEAAGEKTQDRPALTQRHATALILIIVACGAALRFYGIKFGFPANFHPDEVPKVNALMYMRDAGTLNPHYFLHPSLLLYCTYFMNTLFHWLGLDGSWRATAFLAGRTVSAIAGSLAIYFVYLIGRRLYDSSVGLLAALLYAVYPLSVTCSRYLKEDSLFVCMLLACTVALLKAVYEDRKGYLLLAGFLAGCTFSSKYTGMLAIPVVASAPWLKSRSFKPDLQWLKYTILALGLVPVAFVMCTPYSVFDSEKFVKDFMSERHHALRGHTTPIDAWSQYWMYHFARSLWGGMTIISLFPAVLALGLLAWRRKIEDLFIVGMILLFYLPAEWVKSKPAPQPERYILPCVPFLAVAAAELLRVARRHIPRAWPVVLAALIMVAAPAWRSAMLAGEIYHDTRNQMADWMVQNLSHGSKVYLDWKPYAPRFWHNEFEITYVPRATILSKLDLQALKQSGQDYLVLSSLFYDRYFKEPNSTAAIRQRLREVFERVPVVTEFSAQNGTYGFHNPTLTLFSLKPADFAKLEQEIGEKHAGKREHTSNEERTSLRW